MLDARVFTTHGIRGVVGSADAQADDAQWDADGARIVGEAFVTVAGLTGEALVLGHDMRSSGAELARAFADGALAAGADVFFLGQCSTDQTWFTAGAYGEAAVQVSAGHEDPRLNGLKFCAPGGTPVPDDFTARLAARCAMLLEAASTEADAFRRPDAPVVEPGTLVEDDTLADYLHHLRSLVDLAPAAQLSVVVDAGNGMAALTAPAVLGGTVDGAPGVRLTAINHVLDGSFPQHAPDPLAPGSLVQAAAMVRTEGADLGLVFDGDGDRCVVLDENGRALGTATLAALVTRQVLHGRGPGEVVVASSFAAALLDEVCREAGAELVVAAPGHALLRREVQQREAVLGVTSAGQFHFDDLFGAQCGMLVALHLIALLAREGRPLSALVDEVSGGCSSDEIRLDVRDAGQALERMRSAFEGRCTIEAADGLLLSGEVPGRGHWWASARARLQGSELRILVEAADEQVMAAVRDDLCALSGHQPGVADEFSRSA